LSQADGQAERAELPAVEQAPEPGGQTGSGAKAKGRPEGRPLPLSHAGNGYPPACRSSRFWHCGSSSGSTRHIGDFTRWKDHDAYQKALDRLLRDLRVEKS
jgi:hypothetical protein